MSSFPTTLPASTAVPLRGGAVLRWGVLAPGGIAEGFVSALHANSDQRVVAVASRSAERGAAFAGRHGIPAVYGAYDQLVDDAAVEVVYIAAPHSEHRALALLAIAAGKHVLVEKPIALSAAEAREIAAAARAAGVFAMEAMWSRFLPQTTVIRRLLDDGVLGELRLVSAELGFGFTGDLTSRLHDPALGGGALLDLGVYPIWFSHFVLGAPQTVHAFGSLGPTGVDEQATLELGYAGPVQAQLATTLRSRARNGALVAGSDARIEVSPQFFAPGGFTLAWGDTSLEYVHEAPADGSSDGLAWQAAAVAKHVADGLTEAPEHPLDRTIAVLETIDDARTQLGYPPR